MLDDPMRWSEAVNNSVGFYLWTKFYIGMADLAIGLGLTLLVLVTACLVAMLFRHRCRKKAASGARPDE